MKRVYKLTPRQSLSLATLEGEDYVPDHLFSPDYNQPRKGDAWNYVDYSNFARHRIYPLCWNQWQIIQSGAGALVQRRR